MHFYSRNIHGCQLHRTVILWRYLRPKLLVASEFHSFLALGTSAFIPYPDAVATTIQTQTSHLTPIRRSHIGDDPTNHKILNRLAIWARHSRNFLSEEPSPFVHLGFIAASPTAIFQFPSHLTLNSNLFQSFQMAEQQFPVAVAQMHTVTLTVTEIAARGTIVLLHPLTVAILLVTALPYIHEVILIDIALIVVGSDAGTGSDGTVGHHGAHADTRLTGEETVTHLALVVAEESFAAIVSPNAPFLAHLFNIVKDPTELFSRQSHHRIEGSASNWENRKESPTLDTLGNQKFLTSGIGN